MQIQNVDYIDYDTKEFTYNADVPKAYMVSSLSLMQLNIECFMLDHVDLDELQENCRRLQEMREEG